MSDNLADDVFYRFLENITTLVSPLDEVARSELNGKGVPQRPYENGTGRDLLENQRMVLFVREDGSFIPAPDALAGDSTGLVDRDLPALGESGFTITLRFEWFGYPSQEYQLRTYDWCNPPRRIKLSKLAMELAKIVKRHTEKLQGLAIDPEHAMWRVGPNGIQFNDLRIAALEQVSAGSWQPRLFYKP